MFYLLIIIATIAAAYFFLIPSEIKPVLHKRYLDFLKEKLKITDSEINNSDIPEAEIIVTDEDNK